MIALRPYQAEAVAAVARDEAQGFRRLVVSLPTGGGKTIIFSHLTAQRQVPTLILVNSRELVHQAVEKLRMVWPDAPVAVWRGPTAPTTPIVVATVQTLAAQLKRLDRERFALAICDEAHHAVSPSWRRVLEATGFWPDPPPGKLLVGVSATLTRADGLGLGSIFHHISYQIGLLDLIQQGYLAELRAIRVKSRVHLGGIAVGADGDFNAAQLSMAVDTPDRNDLIARAYRRYARGRPAIVFAVTVAHAQHLAEALQHYQIRADWVSGQEPVRARDRKIAQFQAGDLDVLTNAQLLTEGFDAPRVGAIVMARPTKSLALYTQMVGRGTRLAPGKRDCLVLDVADVTREHELQSVASLVGKPLEPRADEGFTKESVPLSGPRPAPEVLPLTGELWGERFDLFSGSVFRWQPDGAQWRIGVDRHRTILLRPVLSSSPQGRSATRYEVVLRQGSPKPGGRQTTCLTPDPLSLEWAMGVAEDWLRTWGGSAVRRDNPTRDGPPTPDQEAQAADLDLAWPPGTTQEMAEFLIGQARRTRALADPDAAWRHEPASERQRQYAQWLGIDVPPEATKAEVSDAIQKARGHRAGSPAAR